MGNLNALRKSGLPVTWNTIWIGYQAHILTVDELQSYAGDLLGTLPDPTAYLVFRLFDADPTNWNEIPNVLELLAVAESAGINESEDAVRDQAERLWNVAAVLHWFDVALANRWRLTHANIEYIEIDLQDKLPFPDRANAVPKFDTYLGCIADYDDTVSSLGAWATGQIANLRAKAPASPTPSAGSS